MAIGIGLAVVLTAIAALHFYWGVGGRWPGTDGPSLSERVVGTRGEPPGFVASTLVTLALLTGAGIVLLGQGEIRPGLQSWIVYGGYAGLIAVFGLRGLATYLTPAFRYARGTPFHDLNRRYYSPLCLAIAAVLVIDYPPGLGAALGLATTPA